MASSEAGASLSWMYSVVEYVASWGRPSSDDLVARRTTFRRVMQPGYVTGTPVEMGSVSEDIVAGVPVRRYVPLDASPGTLVFFHGGGWAIGDLDTHDLLARALAGATRRTVVSVAYRLAPKHVFPAAADDCIAVAKALAMGGGSVVVCGDSAGGNLAAVSANACADAGLKLVGQVLIYPVTDLSSTDRPSYTTYGGSTLLPSDGMRWFIDTYAPERPRRTEPACSPLFAPQALLAQAAPALLVLARCDVLHDEGVAYFVKLKSAGVPAELLDVPGVPHGFVSLQGLSEGFAAVQYIAEWLRPRW